METFGLVLGIFGTVFGVITWFIGVEKQKENDNKLKDSEIRENEMLQKLEILKRERPDICFHDVLMDGMSQSGKTTFIARIINPASSRKNLEQLAATELNYKTIGIPICWENKTKEKNTELHSLQFHDISGENACTFIDALDNISEEKIEETSVILLIIWDISPDRVEFNAKELNQTRINMAYGSKKARKYFKSIIVFFNKIDKIFDKEELRTIIHQETSKIKTLFEEQFDQGYGDIIFCEGSALEGTGVHYCYGEIIKSLELSHNFEPITGSSQRK